MNNTGDTNLNPWLTMWTRPRATTRQLIDEGSGKMAILLASLTGFSTIVNYAAVKNAGDYNHFIFIIPAAAVIGPVSGIISLYIAAFLLKWTGKLIGASSSAPDIRIAAAWSCVPQIWAILLLIPQLALFGNELITTHKPAIEGSALYSSLYLLFGIAEAAAGIWAFILLILSLGQAQGFSPLKALINILLTILVTALPFMLLAFCISYIIP